ncbi:hypothetical protein DMB66_49075 [Actinoplanes sp. ATCC 53533]|nr:hypothetical protein DMB66_49075 [Actinoplanes sp. ATCC 53533]
MAPAGHARPDATPRLYRARWDTDAARDDARALVCSGSTTQPLGNTTFRQYSCSAIQLLGNTAARRSERRAGSG